MTAYAFCKKVFSHPLPIEFLIRSHIPEWADRIDYSTLERRPADFVDENLVQRFADLVWGGRSADARTEFLLLLEICGEPERDMALRITMHRILAVQEQYRQDKALERGERHLTTACVVLYYGDQPWNAPTRLRQVFPDCAPEAYRVISPRLAQSTTAEAPAPPANGAGS